MHVGEQQTDEALVRRIPTPLARGRPGEGFPWEWGVYSWLPGENPALGCGGSELALDLARWGGGNPLVRSGRLAAAIDFAVAGVGDPACDLIPAWSVLTGEAREEYRRELGLDDPTWQRGRGWALSIGLIALPHYRETNPGFAAVARHMIDEVLVNANTRS